VARTGLSDVAGIYHIGVPQNSSEPWKSAAGGVGRDIKSAEMAAVGEALERYSAFTYELPAKRRSELGDQVVVGAEEFSLFSEQQRQEDDFPFKNLYSDEVTFTDAYSIYDNQQVWLPHGLVSLRDDFSTGLSTSSGLAAGPSRYSALLRGIQEVIERDALMVTWLHSIPGRRVKLPSRYSSEVEAKGGEVICIDATPAYSPHPVAVVTGSLPIRGHKRYSLGSACRETWEEAVEKAFLEWSQGVFFAGYYYSLNPDLSFRTYDEVNTFDAHAAYYTVNPREWAKLPLLQGATNQRRRHETKSATTREALTKLVGALKQQKIKLFYRDLTTPDLLQVGVYTIRAVSPDLAPIFCHQRYPFIGGRVSELSWRYPWAPKLKTAFPNPMPHPLG
jgi:ribosomal protein S12 methylthiotransferase accessory factor